MDTVHVFQDAAGQYRWHRKASNGRILFSGEAHPRRRDAIRAAQRGNLDNLWTWHHDTLRDGT